MPANHSTICKFDSMADPTCQLALDSIAAEVEHALNLAHNGSSRGPDSTLSDEDRRCLQDLRVTDPRDDKTRIEQTKGGLLKDAYRWVLTTPEFQRWRDDEHSRLLWIKGDPGKGKTMLLCGIVDELQNTTSEIRPLSYFFCQATDSRINNASAVLRGLMYMLIDQQPALISHLRRKYDLAGKQLFEDVNAWTALKGILGSMLEDPNLQCSYLVIDALDECTTDLSLLLTLIQELAAKSNIKWIVSGRNWPNIEKELTKATQKVRLCLELNEESVSTAVREYVKFKVDGLAQKNDYDSDTQSAVQSHLASKAEGTFLWVALVCQELIDIPGWEAKDLIIEFPPGLDALYKRMMDQICKSRRALLFKSILAVLSVIYRPITLDELVSFFGLPGRVSSQSQAMLEIISLCGSFLTLRGRTIFFVHQSAKDFLITKASNDVFPSGIEEIHHTVFSQSLQALSILCRDIYNLKTPGLPIEKVKQLDLNPDPLSAVGYSCVYWIDHLYDSRTEHKEKNLQENGVIDRFLRGKYLYWLEALSLLRSISHGVLSMIKLESLVQEHASPLVDLTRDGRRFIQYHRAVIESSPLQIYASALIFSPTQSPIRRQFQAEEPQWLITKPHMDSGWSACLTTLEGHGHSVESIAWSSDGRL
ncbi:NACHT-domain-containing protein, partial [Thozetella sp. PMI_491]